MEQGLCATQEARWQRSPALPKWPASGILGEFGQARAARGAFVTNGAPPCTRTVCGVGLKDLFEIYYACWICEQFPSDVHSVGEAVTAQARLGGDKCKGHPA